MKQRQLGPFPVSAIGLGCMNLSHAYGAPPSFDAAQRLLLRALDLGCTLFDTAALYGFRRQRDAGRPGARDAPRPVHARKQVRYAGCAERGNQDDPDQNTCW